MRRMLMYTLLLVAGALICRSIYQNYAVLKEYVYQVSIPSLFCAVLLYCGAIGAQGLYNTGLIFEHSKTKVKLWYLLREYFISKLVRYIPGKVWGIYYQSERLKYVASKQTVWIANFVQFIDANLFSCLVIFVAFLYYFLDQYIAFSMFLILSLVFCFLLKYGIVARIIQVVVHRFGVLIDTPNKISEDKEVVTRYLLLVTDWFFYTCVWVVISTSHFSIIDAISLAILYAGASIIGVAVMVVPSGLFVREASFVALAVWFGYDESLVVFLGIVARLVLTMSDLLSGLFFTLFFRNSLNKVEAYEC